MHQSKLFQKALLGLVFASQTVFGKAPLPKEKPVTIRILLEREAPAASIEMKGRYQIVDPETGSELSSGLFGKRADLSIRETGLHWGDLFPGLYSVRFLPTTADGSILVNGIQYKGALDVYASGSGLNICNEVGVDHYLKSYLSAEIQNPLHPEVLNALAIVARTDIFNKVLSHKNAPWHITAKESHYTGSALSFTKPYIDKAIDATRHVVMTLNQKTFPASWSQHSAGKTVPFSSILRKQIESPEGVAVPIAAKSRDAFRWSFSVPKATLAKIGKLSRLSSFNLYLVPETAKVYAVKLSDGSISTDIDFFSLQKALGSKRLKSNEFTVSLQQDLITFTGFGEGSGSGLCLHSSQTLAEQGKTADVLLKTFFPGIQLEKIDAAP